MGAKDESIYSKAAQQIQLSTRISLGANLAKKIDGREYCDKIVKNFKQLKEEDLPYNFGYTFDSVFSLKCDAQALVKHTVNLILSSADFSKHYSNIEWLVQTSLIDKNKICELMFKQKSSSKQLEGLECIPKAEQCDAILNNLNLDLTNHRYNGAFDNLQEYQNKECSTLFLSPICEKIDGLINKQRGNNLIDLLKLNEKLQCKPPHASVFVGSIYNDNNSESDNNWIYKLLKEYYPDYAKEYAYGFATKRSISDAWNYLPKEAIPRLKESEECSAQAVDFISAYENSKAVNYIIKCYNSGKEEGLGTAYLYALEPELRLATLSLPQVKSGIKLADGSYGWVGSFSK